MFSPDETTLLNLAAMVWREGSISGESRRAIIKLRSLGVTTTEPVLSYAPRVRVRDGGCTSPGCSVPASFDPILAYRQSPTYASPRPEYRSTAIARYHHGHYVGAGDAC